MLRAEVKSSLIGRSLLLTWIVWGGIVVSMAMFGLVVAVVRRPGLENDHLIVPVYAVAVAVAGLSLAVRALSPERLGTRTGIDALMQVQTANEVEARAAQIARGIQTRSIIAFSLSEAISLFGFTLAFMTGATSHFLILTGAALGLMLLVHRPSRAVFEDALAKLE